MKRWLAAVLLSGMLLGLTPRAEAMCPLCKAKAESSVGQNREQAKGLNAGIMYLLVMPYVLAGAIGYWWYTNQRRRKQLADDVYE
ncbi:MAG: hypothetical protein RMK52_04865 [Chitinophagales bacterium]|nr:hypothetical protein [Chitinophagales bacterium]MDW8393558.1 hypothetical protein [Chitinophagales bacterium]